MSDLLFQQGIMRVISDYHAITNMDCRYRELASYCDEISPSETRSRFCLQLLTSKDAAFRCKSQIMSAVLAASADNTWKLILCHAGLIDWVVPVFREGQAVGFFISGSACNSEESKQGVYDQIDLFSSHFKLNKEALQGASKELITLEKGQAASYASLLYDLTQIHLTEHPKTQKITVRGLSKDVLFNWDDEENSSDSPPRGLPQILSEVIYNTGSNKESIDYFWKNIEIKSERLFANLLSKRVLEAHIIYNEIMNLAYNEKDILLARPSAQVLLHIIILTRYERDEYDTRFYDVAYKSMNALFRANSIEEIKIVMEDAFENISAFLVGGSSESLHKPVIEHIMRYLDENYQYGICLEDLAKMVHMSPAYLSRMFKKETSFSIKWYLNKIRMQRAQELLTQTEMPVRDIAVAVGYSDMRGFYKMFSKHFGVTCSEMRKQMGKK